MPAAPGWYPDPDDAHITRYWDGSAWIAQRHWDGSAWVDAEVGASPVQSAPAAAAPALAPAPEPVQPEPAPTPAPTPEPTPAPEPVPQAAQPDLTRTVVLPAQVRPDATAPAPAGFQPVNENKPADQKQLLMIGGAIVAVLLLIVVAVGAVNLFGGGGGDFCGDAKGHEAAAAALGSLPSDRADWTDSQIDSAKEVGDAFKQLADDAPSQIKDDAETVSDLFNKYVDGGNLSASERTQFRTAGDRLETYASAKCGTND